MKQWKLILKLRLVEVCFFRFRVVFFIFFLCFLLLVLLVVCIVFIFLLGDDFCDDRVYWSESFSTKSSRGRVLRFAYAS